MVQQNDIQFDVLPIKLSHVCHSNFYACFYMETTRNDGWNNNNGKYRTTKLPVYNSLNNLSMICVIFSRSLRLDSCQHWLEEELP